jgi:predicted acyltransferase
MSTQDTLDAASVAVKQHSIRPLPARLVSLDAFRGAVIAGMILVNEPGIGANQYAYWAVRHTRWNGWSPADLVFPFFVFLVGVSMVFSNAARRRRGQSKGDLFRHAVARGLIIIGLGLLLNILGADGSNRAIFHFATWRFPGVLQRIGVCYLCAAVVVLWMGWRGRLWTIVALLAGYWALLRFVPVPGFHAGDLSPAGNLTMFLDRTLIPHHLWGRGDSEGILSTLPAIAGTLLGVFVGEWMLSERSPARKLAGLVAAGILGIVLGEALNPFFPINKPLWTSTFVIFTAGFATLLFGIFYWVIDVKNWRRWAHPLVILGMNAIAVYLLSELGTKVIEANSAHLFGGPELSIQDFALKQLILLFRNPHNASLAYGLAFTTLCALPMWILYRKRIFIKV